MNLEIWKNIEEFPDYSVSNYGRVKSLKFKKENTLSPKKTKKGYLEIGLYKNTKRYWKRINRLVLEVFDPRSNINNLEGNHIDGNKENNKFPENIEWCTRSENEKHAYKTGLKNFNKRCDFPNHKLSKDDVKKIYKLSCKGELLQKDIGKLFGITQSLVSMIKNKKRWYYYDK